MRFRYLLYSALTLLLMQGCFTGIESTPRITNTDVKKEHIDSTAEQKFLADIKQQRPSEWKPGKSFRVTDNRIARVLNAAVSPDSLHLAGTDIAFVSILPVKSVIGDDVTMITFTTDKGETVTYRIDIPYNDVSARASLDIPFTVDIDIISEIRSRIVGKRYYIVTPIWYDESGARKEEGLRHIPVDIIDVLPGDDVYPVRVVFKPIGYEDNYSVLMTYGNKRTSTRNFDTLLAFTNPRERYPQITDDTWEMIIHSKVKEGMTKTECRLALGAPTTIGQRPTTAGMVEYWSYADGIFLLFEDGLLSSYRR